MVSVLKSSLLACILLFAAEASALAWTSNLLANPGAEAGTLIGWVTNDPTIVVASTSQAETSGLVLPHSGGWFFNMAPVYAGPPNVVMSRVLYQDADVKAYVAEIDLGLALVKGTTYIQSEDVASFVGADFGQMTLYFMNGTGGTIGQLSTGAVYSPNLSWVSAALDGPIPVGTRTIRFEVLGEKHEGNKINAFFDGASLTLVPEPGTLFLLGLGTVMLRRKR